MIRKIPLSKIPLSTEVVTKEEFDTSIADINNDIEELSAELLPFKESVSSDISALRVSTNTLSSSFSDRLSALDTDTRLRDEALSQSITNFDNSISDINYDIVELQGNVNSLGLKQSELVEKLNDFGELHNYVILNTVNKTDFEAKTNELSNAVSALTENTQTTTESLESRAESLETNVESLSTQVDALSTDLSQLSTKHSEDYSILDGRITSENNSITADLNAFKTTTEENYNNLEGRVATTEGQINDSGTRLNAIASDTATLSAYLNTLSNATEQNFIAVRGDILCARGEHNSDYIGLHSDYHSFIESDYNPFKDSINSDFVTLSTAVNRFSLFEQRQDNPHAVTAEQVGALPISGGTVNGTLNVNPDGTGRTGNWDIKTPSLEVSEIYAQEIPSSTGLINIYGNVDVYGLFKSQGLHAPDIMNDEGALYVGSEAEFPYTVTMDSLLHVRNGAVRIDEQQEFDDSNLYSLYISTGNAFVGGKLLVGENSVDILTRLLEAEEKIVALEARISALENTTNPKISG